MNNTMDKSVVAVGILGGTFDPVHFGHLRSAVECVNAFGLSEMRLMPCHPVHRQTPFASDADRKHMLDLAVTTSKVIRVDDRELQQLQPTYTIDTLRGIRLQMGNVAPLYFAVGVDAFNAIETWKEWPALFDLVNFIVMYRPGSTMAIKNDVLRKKIRVFAGEHRAAGYVYELAVSALDISSTTIRKLVRNRQSIEFLLPPSVETYIHQQRLYQ